MKFLKILAALLLLSPLSQSAWADLCIDPTTGGWNTCSASASGPLGAPGPIGGGTPSTGAFTTISATGAITSTLATGNPPLVVASTTNIPNLNASTLSGKTHADPGPIGSGTPSTGAFTTLSATGAITSTLATGTAPFTVASTTNVANLNASSLSGATFAAPAAIGSGTPAAGTFTTVNASGLITPSSTAGIKGTAAADAAQAGSVGEIFTVNCFMGAAAAAASNVSTPVASPGLVTWASHTFVLSSPAPANWSCPINFTTAGALPTGLTVGTTYYIIGSTWNSGAETFQVSDTMAHALAGTNAINFTVSTSGQSGAYIGYLISTGNTVGTAGLSVTAGDWDCSATATSQELTSLTITEFLTAINTSVAIGTVGTYANFQIASNVLGAANSSYVSPVVQENVSSSTTVYAVSKAAFSAGTQNMGAFLRCRRMR